MSTERNIAYVLAFRTEDGQRAFAVADVNAPARRVVADIIRVPASADSLQSLKLLCLYESNRAVAALVLACELNRAAQQAAAAQKASRKKQNVALVFTDALLSSRRERGSLPRLTLCDVHFVERGAQSPRQLLRIVVGPEVHEEE